MKDAIMGFLKLYLVLVGVYYVNVLCLQILNNFDSSGLTLFFCLILSALVCGMASSVVLYTITGFATLDFSNGTSMKGFLKGLDKLTFGLSSKLFKGMSSTIGTMFASTLNVASKRNNLDRNVSSIDLANARYEDSNRVDDYIKSRYGHYSDVNTTDDFYRRERKFGRADRMRQRVEIDLEDDGDYLA